MFPGSPNSGMVSYCRKIPCFVFKKNHNNGIYQDIRDVSASFKSKPLTEITAALFSFGENEAAESNSNRGGCKDVAVVEVS